MVRARSPNADDDMPLAGVRRIVFLGDSITYSGQYVEYIEAYLRTSQPTHRDLPAGLCARGGDRRGRPHGTA